MYKYKFFVESVAIPDLASRRPYAVVSERSEEATYRAFGMLNPVLPRSQQITYLVLFSLVSHFKRPATSLRLVVTTIQRAVYWPNRPLRLNTRPCLLTGSASVPDTTLACHAFHELSSAADRSRVRYARRLRTISNRSTDVYIWKLYYPRNVDNTENIIHAFCNLIG